MNGRINDTPLVDSETPPMTDGLDTPLPCDVQIAHIRYHKGVALRTLVNAATRWHARASALSQPPSLDREAVARKLYDADPPVYHQGGPLADQAIPWDWPHISKARWFKLADAILSSLPPAGGWRPIATAPRDREIWLYDGKRQFVGWWQVNPRDEEFWMDEADSEPEPTHWQPLPSPPTDTPT